MGIDRRALLGALVVVAVASAGCGSSSDDDATSTAAAGATGASTAAPAATTEAKAKVAPNIAVVMLVSSDYQEAQMEGVQKVVSENGGSYKTFVANYDPQKLTSQCTDAINSGKFNAILLQTLDPPTGIPCVTAAKAKGIPVVALNGAIGKDPNDIEPQVDGVVGGIYSTPAENAKSNVELATKACAGKDPCNIIAELATPTDPMTNQVVDAVAREVPNAKIVGKFASGFDPGVVATKMKDLLTAHPDTDVFMAIQDGSIPAAVPAVKAAGLEGKIKMIGDGGSRQGAKDVASGLMFGTTGNWPIQEGEITAGMAVKALNGEPIDPKGYEQDFIDKPSLLTKENIDQFTPEWGAST